MKQTIIFMLILTLSVTACTRDNSLSPRVEPTAPATTTSTTTPQAKTSVSGTTVEYRINTAYESNYAHWSQKWAATPLTSSQTYAACGPVSYMLSAHMLLGSSFPSSGSKLAYIVNRLQSTYGVFVPININVIPTYLTGTDGATLTSSGLIGYSHLGGATTADRNNFKSALQSELANGWPVMVPVNINIGREDDSRYTTENSTTNYDTDGSDVSGRPNYLTGSISAPGHFIVLIGIKVNTTTGGGYVYYKDPYSVNSTTKVASYERFLNSALANGGTYNGYDAIAIRKK